MLRRWRARSLTAETVWGTGGGKGVGGGKVVVVSIECEGERVSVGDVREGEIGCRWGREFIKKMTA